MQQANYFPKAITVKRFSPYARKIRRENYISLDDLCDGLFEGEKFK